MGDGLLCSVGYPFEAISSNIANDAVDLALRFAKALADESRLLHTEKPIICCIGLAIDTLIGFYPESGAKEYDIYGPAIVLATRYEAMRKVLFEQETKRSMIIIQEMVYLSLDPSHRQGFIEFNMKSKSIVVRDDPSASRLFFLFLEKDGSVGKVPARNIA